MVKINSPKEILNSIGGLFDNLPKLLQPKQVAALLGLKLSTIYDWRYRGDERNVPRDLFYRFNRLLYLRTEVLRDWFASQNPAL